MDLLKGAAKVAAGAKAAVSAVSDAILKPWHSEDAFSPCCSLRGAPKGDKVLELARGAAVWLCMINPRQHQLSDPIRHGCNFPYIAFDFFGRRRKERPAWSREALEIKFQPSPKWAILREEAERHVAAAIERLRGEELFRRQSAIETSYRAVKGHAPHLRGCWNYSSDMKNPCPKLGVPVPAYVQRCTTCGTDISECPDPKVDAAIEKKESAEVAALKQEAKSWM